MGEVYRALDEELGREVALKLLRADADGSSLPRFKREARAASAFQHPNAARIYDVGTHNGRPFIVMELVVGDSLRARVGRSDTTDEARVAWLVQIAQALGAAHDVGLVHRDVKPDNVVVARDDGVAKVLDFGIARTSGALVDGSEPTSAEPTLTASGAAIGTPAYMSPEQIRGDAVDARSDQFSWGVTAFELFTGELPWSTTSSALAMAGSILHEAHRDFGKLAPAAPPAVVRVIERALSKDPADRFPTIREAGAALEDAAAIRGLDGGAATGSATGGGVVADAERKPPWGILLIAGVITIFAYWLYGAIVTPVPPPPRLMGSGPRAPILGLDDSATRQREAELDLPVSKQASMSASPAASSSAGVDLAAFGRRCSEEEGKSRHCVAENDAWCDMGGASVACCARGLAATLDGHCVCAPGGSTVKAIVESGCTAARTDYKSHIQGTVRAHFDGFRQCYEGGLTRNPKLKGKLSVRFVIAPDGTIPKAELAGASAPDAEFQTCLVAAFAKLRFDPPPNGGMTVEYPLDFDN